MRDKVRIGIIGAGRIGKVHAANIAFRIPEAELAAIADVDFDSATALASRFAGTRALKNANDVLTDPQIDAVLICSSTNTHAGFIVDAAREGKHIFCEKPIDHTLEKIDHALAAVDKADVKLQIGFNRRFDANFVRVRNAIRTAEIGTPHLVHIISRDPGPPPISYVKVSGGMFLDMTIHDFDMARFLTGSEVKSVYATAQVRVDPEVGKAGDVDTALIVLEFANGVIGTIDNCRQAPYGYDQRVEVLGSKGSIATENLYPNRVEVSTAESVRRDLPLNFFMDRYADSFVNEMREFVDAVLKGTPTPVTGADGRAPVVMALAAKRSYEERRPVEVTEIRSKEAAFEAVTH